MPLMAKCNQCGQEMHVQLLFNAEGPPTVNGPKKYWHRWDRVQVQVVGRISSRIGYELYSACSADCAVILNQNVKFKSQG